MTLTKRLGTKQGRGVWDIQSVAKNELVADRAAPNNGMHPTAAPRAVMLRQSRGAAGDARR